MIRVYAKDRHVEKIGKFLNSLNLENEIYTIYSNPPYENESFELGISYGYNRKITNPLLSIPKKGFVNFHPTPLPEYRGNLGMLRAIENKVMRWGVTCHFMDEGLDTGDIIKVKYFDLHERPTSTDELSAISHYFMFSLFKEIIPDIISGDAKKIPQADYKSDL